MQNKQVLEEVPKPVIIRHEIGHGKDDKEQKAALKIEQDLKKRKEIFQKSKPGWISDETPPNNHANKGLVRSKNLQDSEFDLKDFSSFSKSSQDDDKKQLIVVKEKLENISFTQDKKSDQRSSELFSFGKIEQQEYNKQEKEDLVESEIEEDNYADEEDADALNRRIDNELAEIHMDVVEFMRKNDFFMNINAPRKEESLQKFKVNDSETTNDNNLQEKKSVNQFLQHLKPYDPKISNFFQI